MKLLLFSVLAFSTLAGCQAQLEPQIPVTESRTVITDPGPYRPHFVGFGRDRVLVACGTERFDSLEELLALLDELPPDHLRLLGYVDADGDVQALTEAVLRGAR